MAHGVVVHRGSDGVEGVMTLQDPAKGIVSPFTSPRARAAGCGRDTVENIAANELGRGTCTSRTVRSEVRKTPRVPDEAALPSVGASCEGLATSESVPPHRFPRCIVLGPRDGAYCKHAVILEHDPGDCGISAFVLV